MQDLTAADRFPMPLHHVSLRDFHIQLYSVYVVSVNKNSYLIRLNLCSKLSVCLLKCHVFLFFSERAVARPSVVCLSVCLSVCNACAP